MSAEQEEVQNQLAEEVPETPESQETPDPPESPETPETPETEEGKKRRDASDRIRETLAREKAAREYGEYWRRKALEREKPQEAPKPKPAPKIEDYGGDATKWSAAYAEWSQEEIDRKAAEAAQKHVETARQTEVQQQEVSTWNERLSAFAEEHPDVHDVLSNPALPISEPMRDVIVSSGLGPDLAYHLGTNPGEAAKIARMSPARAAAALGRMEAKIEGEKAAPKKTTTTKAPPPPNTISGEGSTKADNDMEMPLEDFLAKITRKGRK